jgi:hypothetical protein
MSTSFGLHFSVLKEDAKLLKGTVSTLYTSLLFWMAASPHNRAPKEILHDVLQIGNGK